MAVDEDKKRRQALAQPVGPLGPQDVPTSIRMPGGGVQQLNTVSPVPPPGPSPRAQGAQASGPSVVQQSPYQRAYQEYGGGIRGAGAVTTQALKRTFVDAPQYLGRQVERQMGALYGPPARVAGEFGAGMLGIRPAQPQAAPAAAIPAETAQPTPQQAAPPQQPSYFDPAQAERTRQTLNQPAAQPAAQPTAQPTLNDAPQGGAAIQFPGQGVRIVTPEQASDLSKRVNVVSSQAFLRNPQLEAQLSAARSAAADRGDFEGIRRSYLSPEDREAENQAIRQRRAASGERQRLEAQAREPIPGQPTATAARNRAFAGQQLKRLDERTQQQQSAQAKAEQQAFENQIALGNLGANQARALRRPSGQFQVVMQDQYDDQGFKIGQTPLLLNNESGTLTPMGGAAAPQSAVGVPKSELVPGQVYTGKTGEIVVWDGEKFVEQQ